MKNTTRLAFSNNHPGQTRRRELGRTLLVAVAFVLSIAGLRAQPSGGQVISGAGSIAQEGATTTITQTSQNLSLNWATFNIAPQETVNFLQPSATAIAVNRIFDTNGTQILGQLNANGQVYLINPNGIVFGSGAQVNVGGMVASTLDLNDTSLNHTARSFAGNGNGEIVNHGIITAASGGYVALLANRVSNQGTIIAPLGAVGLGAGSAFTLTFNDNNLVQLQVDQSVLNSQAENGGLIRADGGFVIMTAGAKDALLASVVNNTGIIQARTVENRSGVITLLGGMAAGTALVDGTLDASAPQGGNGGFIETSAATVYVADNVMVTTHSTGGNTGTWLIDPADFTIAVAGGNITGTALSTSLTGSSVLIQSSTGTLGGNGDINVNDAVSWSANSLTLTAARDININAVMSASGSSLLVMNTATANGADGAVAGGAVKVGLISGAFTGRVDFPGRSGPGILTINGLAYTIVNALGLSTTVTTTDLQGMKSGLATNYALGTNIDASATSAWNAGAGFVPIGTPGTPFAGRFDGLGHTITGLSVTSGAASAGLFGATGPGLSFNNVGLVGGNTLGAAGTGGLIGTNGTGSTVSNSYNTGTVTGSAGTGGLVGDNTTGAITFSFTTGAVNGAAGTGGLVGSNTTGVINKSYSTSAVTGSGAGTGGLVGSNTTGAISKSFASGNVTGTGAATGGLAGSNGASLVTDTYATGTVTGGGSGVGGLLGSNDGVVTTSYSAGSVNGAGSNKGSLVGLVGAGTVTNSFWDSTNSVVQAGGGIGMSTAQMMALANFTSPTPANGNVNPNWNFGTTWVLYEGLTYPLLQPFMTPLTVTAANATQVYNGVAYAGGNGVTYSTTPNGSLLGTVSYSGTSQGAINVNSYNITPAGLYSNQQGYIITFANGTLAVNPRPVNLSGSRVFDSTLNVAAGALTVGNLVGTQTLALTGTGTVANKNAGALKPLTLGTLALGNGTNGGLASNYTFTGGTQTATITAAPLTIGTGSVTKIYDGNLTALGTAILTGGTLYAGDTISGGAFAFTDKNVGAGNKTVTVSGVTVADGNAGGNYSISYVNNTTSTINPFAVSLTGTRVYDGTVNMAAGVLTIGTLAGAETLTLTGTGTVANKNVGALKPLTLGTLALGNGTNGGLASNYTFTGGTQTANVTAAGLVLSTINVSKVFDGGLSALGTAVVSSGTLFTGDTISGGTFAFTSPDIGLGNKTVTTAAVTVTDGNAGGNYAVSYVNNTTSTISAVAVPPVVVPPVVVPPATATASGQILSIYASLERKVPSLTPTITVKGRFEPVEIVDSFALETGNGRAVNSAMNMGRKGPDLLLVETNQTQRDEEKSRTSENSAGIKTL